MNRGLRYWVGEVVENFGLPLLGIILFGATFLLAQLLPWWGPFALLGGVVLVGSLWLRPKWRVPPRR